jgi:hypothetical protein
MQTFTNARQGEVFNITGGHIKYHDLGLALLLFIRGVSGLNLGLDTVHPD